MAIDDNFLIELHYLPQAEIIARAYSQNKITIEAHETYQKGSFRNKAHIAAPNHYQLLSVPLKSGKNNSVPIKEVEISYQEDWISHHLKSIDTAYSASPYYEYYIDELVDILNRKYEYLWELNVTLLMWLREKFEFEFKVQFTSEWQRTPDITDLRDSLKAGIEPEIRDENYIKPYPQVYEDRYGYRNNMSVLDLLFCAGPEARQYFV